MLELNKINIMNNCNYIVIFLPFMLSILFGSIAVADSKSLNLPKNLHKIVDDAITEKLKLEDINKVGKSDEINLITYYKETDNLEHKKQLVYPLAIIGGSDKFNLLKQTLLFDYKNRIISSEERWLFFNTIKAIGLISSENNAAFNYLKNGLEQSFWKQKIKWKSDNEEYSQQLLTSASIQAIGLSGRKDAILLLKKLKKRNKRYLHMHAGDITQAMFYNYLRKEYGIMYLEGYLLRTHKDSTQFEKWINTSEGKKWNKWANNKMRGPRPDKK